MTNVPTCTCEASWTEEAATTDCPIPRVEFEEEPSHTEVTKSVAKVRNISGPSD